MKQESPKWEFKIKTDVATLLCSYDSELVVNRIVKNLQRIAGRNCKDFVLSEDVQGYVDKVLHRQITRTLRDALDRAEIEAQKRTLRELNNSVFHLEPDKLERWSEQAARNARVDSRRRLGLRMRGGSEPDYDLSNLTNHYNELRSIWRDAKSLYRRNSESRNWREMIRVEYTDLPLDLINRLVLQGESRPSDLALEHAARLCGVPKNHYTTRWLRQQLRENR